MLFLAKPQPIELSLELAAVHHCRKRRILNSLRSRQPNPLRFHSHLHLLAIVAQRLLPAATGLIVLDARTCSSIYLCTLAQSKNNQLRIGGRCAGLHPVCQLLEFEGAAAS
jgi:hypothetical protein